MNASAEANPELTILMPCLDEARTIAACVRMARNFLERSGVHGEILIADNGSTDGSQKIAIESGARVVDVPARGYGNALMHGIREARGTFVIMGDADESYDFDNLEAFVEKLRSGFELVMGNRFRGGIKPGAMPLLHRYFGNPFLTNVGRLFFGSPAGDFQCGLRGFRRQSIVDLNLRTTGMEFASEMVVKATLGKLRIAEVPTTLSPDGRERAPHLRTWSDGWRYLRFLLMYSPRWLFLYPGLVLTVLGLIGVSALMPGPILLGRVAFDLHTMLYLAFSSVIGVQLVGFAVLSKVIAIDAGLLPADPKLERFLARVSLEMGVVAGAALGLVGAIGAALTVVRWGNASFGDWGPGAAMRLAIPSATAMAIGASLVFSSFMLGIVKLPRR